MSKYRCLFAIVAAGILLLIFGCKSTGVVSTWANGYQALNARFANIAVITDFADVVTTNSKSVVFDV